MPWPMDPGIARSFARGLREIVVIEDKSPSLESIMRDALWNCESHPVIVGKLDDMGQRLFHGHGSLDADSIVEPLRRRLAQRLGDDVLTTRAAVRTPALRTLIPLSINRTPYFCSGCPHNTSTQVPEGAEFGGGIGCSTMAG